MIDDVKISSSISNKKTVTLDLNGYTITGTDTTEKNFGLIANRGKLTIKDSVGTGAITVTATVNSGWNRYSAVISNEVGGELTVESGLIEHLGGTDMAYGIDALTNGKGGTVSTTINGGTVKSTYRAIRQFLNSTTDMNTLVINGGIVEGDNKAVFVHSPSAKANVGAITVEDEAALTGGVYLYATAGATEFVVDVQISVEAVGAGNVTTANIPVNYALKAVDGNYTVKEGTYVAEIDGERYETLQQAVSAVDSNDDKIYLINDIEVDEVIRLESKFKVQIYGEGHTVTGSAKKVFEVYTPSASFNNMTIINTAYQGRCVDTRVDNTHVSVNNSELKVTDRNTQPITIGGSNTNDNKMVHLNVYNSTITADNGGYAIIVFQPADIAITASNVTGYSALYMKDGSAGSIVNIGGKSVLTGNNEANSYTNAFGTVVFETEGITMNVNQYPTLIANNTGDQSQSIFELKGNANTITMNGKVELNGKNTFILSNLVYDEQTPVTVSDSLVELVEAEGYIVEGNIVKGVNMLSFVDESVMIRNLKKRSVLVLSSYTENGKLIDVKLVDITSDGYTAMSDTGLNTNAHVIKAALWDSVANMTPLCPAIIK